MSSTVVATHGSSIVKSAGQSHPIISPIVVLTDAIEVSPVAAKVTPCSRCGNWILLSRRSRKLRQSRSDLGSTNQTVTRFAAMESLIVTVFGWVSLPDRTACDHTGGLRSAGGGGRQVDTNDGKDRACVKPLTGCSKVATC